MQLLTLNITFQILINSKKLKHLIYQFKNDGYHLATPRSSLLSMQIQNMTSNGLIGLGLSRNGKMNLPKQSKINHKIPNAGFEYVSIFII